MVAQQVNLEYGEFIHTFGDAHIYQNHKEQAELQLKRTPKSLPTVMIKENITNIFDYEYTDFTLENYYPDDHIKAKVAI